MNLINKIITSKQEIVIVSPHFDDSVLSCFELLRKLNKKTKITIVNVFTKAGKPPYTVSAKKYLRTSGFSNAEVLFKERNNEDISALSGFDVKIVNLGLVDALYRQKKNKNIFASFLAEFGHMYPTYRFHIIKQIAKNDSSVSILEQKLVKYKNSKTLVLAPVGIGNHADHRIVRDVCKKLFDNLILYSDFPYNMTENGISIEKSYPKFQLQPEMDKKIAVLKQYKTQFNGLFPGGIVPKHTEIYYQFKNI